MVISFEFDKVGNAFKRVKQDIISLKNYIKDLYAKDQQRVEDFRRLQMQIDMLTKEIILIKSEKNITTTVNKTIVEKEEESVIGNSDSEMAHVESCPYGKKVTDEHKVFFKDKADAGVKGYKFCSCMKE